MPRETIPRGTTPGASSGDRGRAPAILLPRAPRRVVDTPVAPAGEAAATLIEPRRRETARPWTPRTPRESHAVSAPVGELRRGSSRCSRCNAADRTAETSAAILRTAVGAASRAGPAWRASRGTAQSHRAVIPTISSAMRTGVAFPLPRSPWNSAAADRTAVRARCASKVSARLVARVRRRATARVVTSPWTLTTVAGAATCANPSNASRDDASLGARWAAGAARLVDRASTRRRPRRTAVPAAASALSGRCASAGGATEPALTARCRVPTGPAPCSRATSSIAERAGTRVPRTIMRPWRAARGPARSPAGRRGSTAAVRCTNATTSSDRTSTAERAATPAPPIIAASTAGAFPSQRAPWSRCRACA